MKPQRKQIDQQTGYKEHDQGYDKENVKTHFEDEIVMKVKELQKDMELQQTKLVAQSKNIIKDKETSAITQKIQEASQTKLFKSMADRILQCQRFKQQDITAYSTLFMNLQKQFDELYGNKKTIVIKFNRALELFNLETFKCFEEIHENLVRIEGTGKCGGSEVLKSFDDKMKLFSKFTYAWQLLPQMENQEQEAAITSKPILNEKELRRFVSELVHNSYPQHYGIKEVERIVEKTRDVERIVHVSKEVPIYLEKEAVIQHDHTREAHEYLFGLTRYQNIKKALELYHLEADNHQNTVAYNVLGQLYAEGKMVQMDMDRAFNYYHQSSQKNDPEGLYWVGTFLLKGLAKSDQIGKHLNSRDAEIEEGIYLLKQAEKYGSSDAMTDLGHVYSNGIESTINSSNWIIKPDLKHAEVFHFKAAKLNNQRSLLDLGLFYQNHQDYKSQHSQITPAIEYIKISQEMGYPSAFYELGLCYELGLGVQIDLQRAKYNFHEGATRGEIRSIEKHIFYLWKASKESNLDSDYQQLYNYIQQTIVVRTIPFALHILGTLYQYGQGVSKDIKTALNCFQKAGKLNFTDSLMKLGNLYYQGVEISQSLKDALCYYEQASADGNVEAKVLSGLILLHGASGVNQDQGRAYGYLHEAYQLGDVDAEYQLAIMYKQGLFVEQDEQKCFDLLKKAELRGHPESKTALHQMGYKQNIQGQWQAVIQVKGCIILLFIVDNNDPGSPGFGSTGTNWDFMGLVGTSQMGSSYLSQKPSSKMIKQTVYKKQNDESILVSQIVYSKYNKRPNQRPYQQTHENSIQSSLKTPKFDKFDEYALNYFTAGQIKQ